MARSHDAVWLCARRVEVRRCSPSPVRPSLPARHTACHGFPSRAVYAQPERNEQHAPASIHQTTVRHGQIQLLTTLPGGQPH